MQNKVVSMKAWRTTEYDGFVCVGHRGQAASEFETVVVPIAGTETVLRLEGRFNVIQAEGLRDALQIHELKSATVDKN